MAGSVTVAGPIQERHARMVAPETVSCLCASPHLDRV